MDLVGQVFLDYTIRTVVLGSAALGIISGALGCYAVLRRQSLLGDAISHAALPGIALAFILTHSKAPLVLILGAAVAGWLSTLAILAVVNNTRVKYDSALGLVLSTFFGAGLVLLTFIQKRPDATQAGLDTFLFGQAATLLQRDVVAIGSLGGLALLVVMALWKEFKLLSFDPAFGASLGLPVRFLDVALTSLLVIAIVVGLQTVGVVLMSSMIVGPAVAARQWTDRLGYMVVFSGLFGAAAGISGALVSSAVARVPTGPSIVLSLTAIVILSLLVAPNHGIVWAWLRRRRSEREVRLEAVLSDLYTLASQHNTLDHSHSTRVLEAMRRGGGVRRSLRLLAERGLVQAVAADGWALTATGQAEARRLAAREVR